MTLTFKCGRIAAKQLRIDGAIVPLAHCPHHSPDKEIESFVSRQSHDGKAASSVLVVITGDDDFTKSIRLAMNAGMDVEVLHPPPPQTSTNLLDTINGRPNLWHHDWLEFLEYWLRTHNNCTGLPEKLELPPQRTSSGNNAGEDGCADGKGGYRWGKGPAGGNRQQSGNYGAQEDAGAGYRQRKTPPFQPPPPPPPQHQPFNEQQPQRSWGGAGGGRPGNPRNAWQQSFGEEGAEERARVPQRGQEASGDADRDWDRDSKLPSVSATLQLAELQLIKEHSEPALALSAVINWLLKHRHENSEWFKALRTIATRGGCKLILGKELYNTGEVVILCPTRPPANHQAPDQSADRTARRTRDLVRGAILEALLDVPGLLSGSASGARPQAFWPPSLLDRLKGFRATSRLSPSQMRAFLEQWSAEVPFAVGPRGNAGGQYDLLRLVNLFLSVEAELGLEASTLPADVQGGAAGGAWVLVPVEGSERCSLTSDEERAAVRGFLLKRFTTGQLLARLRSLGLKANGVEKSDLADTLMSTLLVWQ